MRGIKYRKRTVDDDVNSVLHLKADTESPDKDTLILPEKSVDPIVVWTKTCSYFNPRDVHLDELNGYIKSCMDWPLKTDTLCYNCCHSFTTVPVPLPYRYDKMRNIYKCRGVFCSWQCTKAYNIDTITHVGRGEVNTNIALLAYRLWTKYLKDKDEPSVDGLRDYTRFCIKTAPNKNVLKVFGGTQTIEEYRKGSYGIIPPSEALDGKPFISVKSNIYLPFSSIGKSVEKENTVETVSSTSANPGNMMNTMVTSAVHKHANEFCDKLNRAKQEKIVIKRKREDSTKNTLISSMGVKVAQRKR